MGSIYRQVAPLEQGWALCFLPSGRTYLWSEIGSSAGAIQGGMFMYLQTGCSAGARMCIVFSAVRQNLSVERNG